MKLDSGYRNITDQEFEVDIPNGMPFELYTMRGWVKGIYPDVLNQNEQLDEYGDDNMMKLAHAITRIKIQP